MLPCASGQCQMSNVLQMSTGNLPNANIVVICTPHLTEVLQHDNYYTAIIKSN